MQDNTESLNWRISSRCSAGGCVEVANGERFVHVRDSKNPNSPVLDFSVGSWLSFIAGIRAGDFTTEAH